MTKVSTQAIAAIFNSYDAGSRTKAMRKLASEKSIEHCVSIGFINDAQFEAFERHSKLASGKVAMMQIAKAIDFIATGDPKSIDKATAALITVCILNEAGTKPQTFENARFTLSAKGTENSQPLQGVNSARLRKCIGSISNMSTVSAQTSRTVGVNGSLGIMGATSKTSAHEFTVNAGSRENPFLLAYARALSKLPEGVLVAKFTGDEASE
jgi:hypothetical protein